MVVPVARSLLADARVSLTHVQSVVGASTQRRRAEHEKLYELGLGAFLLREQPLTVIESFIMRPETRLDDATPCRVFYAQVKRSAHARVTRPVRRRATERHAKSIHAETRSLRPEIKDRRYAASSSHAHKNASLVSR